MYSVLSIVIIPTLYGLVPTHLTQPHTQYSVFSTYSVRITQFNVFFLYITIYYYMYGVFAYINA